MGGSEYMNRIWIYLRFTTNGDSFVQPSVCFVVKCSICCRYLKSRTVSLCGVCFLFASLIFRIHKCYEVEENMRYLNILDF